MLSTDDLRNIKNDCEKAGYKIVVKDISFAIVKKMYEDVLVAYKSIYNDNRTDTDIIAFTKTPAMTFLFSYLDSMFKQRGGSSIATTKSTTAKTKDVNDITFEENKAEIIRLIKETQDARANGEMDVKDALKLEGELRVKLNDKFKVQEEVKDNVVVVNQKYNDVCPRCHTEIARKEMTKDEAMKTYNLVEKY